MLKTTPALRQAQAKYRASKRAVKTVTFNRETEADLWAQAQSIPDFTGWVKGHLRAEMAGPVELGQKN